jgi:hypothetical protein
MMRRGVFVLHNTIIIMDLVVFLKKRELFGLFAIWSLLKTKGSTLLERSRKLNSIDQ